MRINHKAKRLRYEKLNLMVTYLKCRKVFSVEIIIVTR